MAQEQRMSEDGLGVTLGLGPVPDGAADTLGQGFDVISRFAELLAVEGPKRGLIGPREVPRLWERHIANCAAVVPFLPDEGILADLGSGAGLPGLVVAAMKPTAQVVLIEPMSRRCDWLNEVVVDLGLKNVSVHHARAEELIGDVEADALTARAVAPLVKLANWAFPLVRRGGTLALLKGRSAPAEIDAARSVLARFTTEEPSIHEAATFPGLESTTVVTLRRTL